MQKLGQKILQKTTQRGALVWIILDQWLIPGSSVLLIPKYGSHWI